MKITMLIENHTSDTRLIAEHGLAVAIEIGKKKILLDTGFSGRFIDNSIALGIDLLGFDAIVLSHGHYDHTGGLTALLWEKPDIPVIMKREAREKKYRYPQKYIGMPMDIDWEKTDTRLIREPFEIGEGAFVIPEIPIVYDWDVHNKNLMVAAGDRLTEDDFSDELYLALVENGELTILSGCAHRGILNILEDARSRFSMPIRSVIGGFHWKGETVESLSRNADELEKFGIRHVGVCHCTGLESFAFLKGRMPQSVFYHETGTKYEQK